MHKGGIHTSCHGRRSQGGLSAPSLATTAKALGIEVPNSIQLLADEVIE
jgi:hypothetical protein